MRVRRSFLLAAVILVPAAASAHPGHAAGPGPLSGLAHALFGHDHLMALAGLGAASALAAALAWRRGRRARSR
jgi:urease accessory protein